MLDVHQKGRAVVSTGSREKMERDTEALQATACGRRSRRTS